MADTNNTAAQTYIAAMSAVLLASDQLDNAREFLNTASRQMREAGFGDDPEMVFAVMEESVEASGLPDDNKQVIKIRESAQMVLKVAEAIANGHDPQEAKLAGLLGIDPRKQGGGNFEF